MLKFLKDPAYLAAMREERVFFIQRIGAPIPSFNECWKTLVEQNDIIDRIDPIKDAQPRVFVATSAEEIPIVNQLKRMWASSFPRPQDYKFSAHLYYGDADTASLGVHEDYVDVLFWCMHGMVEWHVPKGGRRTTHDDPLEEYDKYVLHPGDAIYCPTAFRHKVVSVGERFGISFGASKPSYNDMMPEWFKRHLAEKHKKIKNEARK